MPIAYATKCSVWEITLSGGIDTFGPHDEPLCSEHWFKSINVIGNEKDLAKAEVTSLIAQIADKEEEIEDLQFELHDLEDELGKACKKFAELHGQEYHTMFDDRGNLVAS